LWGYHRAAPKQAPELAAHPQLPAHYDNPVRLLCFVAAPAALLALAEALGFTHPDWQAGSEPCAEPQPWPHLYCNPAKRVYMIDLSSKGLKGALGDEVDLEKLPYLQALWLYDNPSLAGQPCSCVLRVVTCCAEQMAHVTRHWMFVRFSSASYCASPTGQYAQQSLQNLQRRSHNQMAPFTWQPSPVRGY
jgi:hypothetical protein